MTGARRPGRAGLGLLPRRSVYLVGALSAVKALGLVLLAESIARGVAAVAVGDPAWRDALIWGVAAALLRAGAAWATQVAAARAAIGTKESLRARLADTLIGGTPRVGSSAALATRELDALDDFFGSVLPAITSVAVIPLLVGARILVSDWVSALIIVLTVPLIPLFMILVGQYTQQKTDAASLALARLSDHVVELARGLPVLVGLGRVEEQAAALDRISDDYRRTTMLTLRTAFLSALVLELIATLSVAVVAVFIGVRMIGGDLTLATGLAVLILAPECYAPFRDLGSAFHASRSGLNAMASVEQLLDSPPRPRLPRTAGGTPEVHDLTVSYEGHVVVRRLSFGLPAYGITALVGASGSGKSTVLRALAGRLDADTVGWLQGFDRVAWAPQHPHTVEPTVRAEFALYADDETAVERMLDRLGLDSVAGSDPARLSPGELRRVAVGRALLRRAPVILLDEPTAHLDDVSAAAVVELIEEAGRHASVLVASHDSAITAIADHFVELGATSQRSRLLGLGVDGVSSEAEPVLEQHVTLDHNILDPDDTPATVRPGEALMSFVRPALGRYLGAIALGALASAFAIALTAVSAWLIVRASEQPAIMYLLVAIVGVRFFGLGRAALRYCERLVTHDAVFASTTSLRHRLWASLASRGASSRVLQRGGTALDYLVAAADDVRDLVPRIVVPAAVGIVISAAALLTTWLILPGAVGVLALVLLVSAVVAPAVAIVTDRAAETDRLAQRAGILRRFAAALDAADDLRGNGVDDRVRSALRSLDDEAGRSSRRVATSRGLGAALVVFAGCAGAMGMLAVTATSSLPVSLAAVLVLLPVALIDPLLGLLAALAHWPALTAALGRVGELGDPVPASPRDTLDEPVHSLSLSALSAGWPGAPDVFHGVSATVATGEWLVVDGPSGSGKSTLLSVLLGSLEPSSGWLLVNGVDSASLALPAHVAWCPQEAHLFDSTIRANLLLGRPREDRPTDEELVDAMQAAGLGSLLTRLPEGLETRIGSQGSSLSGGERQRLAVARTLLSRADIILLDEPTAHLDEQTAHELIADLRVAFEDRIVVLVTHHADDRIPGDARLTLGGHVVYS